MKKLMKWSLLAVSKIAECLLFLCIVALFAGTICEIWNLLDYAVELMLTAFFTGLFCLFIASYLEYEAKRIKPTPSQKQAAEGE